MSNLSFLDVQLFKTQMFTSQLYMKTENLDNRKTGARNYFIYLSNKKTSHDTV